MVVIRNISIFGIVSLFLLVFSISINASEIQKAPSQKQFYETCVNPLEGGEWCYGKNFFS